MIKGDTPMATTGARMARRRRKYRACSLSRVRLPSRNSSTHTAESTWESTVARAAPCTPMSKTKIKMGSRMILATAPMMTVSMEKAEKPWVVMKLFSPRETSTAMVPQR